MEENNLAGSAAVTEADTMKKNASPEATPSETNTSAEKPDKDKDKDKDKEEEEEGSWVGGLLFLAVIGAALWALIHFNPSEEKHREVLSQDLAEAYVDAAMQGYTLDTRTLSRLKYGSLGICSWTYVKRRGKFEIATVGACGYVLSLVD